MSNVDRTVYRKYGERPHAVAVIHGGPGDMAGELAPIAKELSAHFGVLEPLQRQDSLNGQIEELQTTLKQHADMPVVLIGFSWGAILSCLLTERSPSLIKKLIVVGCPPLERGGGARVREQRQARLSREEWELFTQSLHDPGDSTHRNAQVSSLCMKTDSVDPIENAILHGDYHIFNSVWKEVEALRESGELLSKVQKIKCPIVAIHGLDDPHPIESVRACLAPLEQFRLISLAQCGHRPWIERHAKDLFYQALVAECRP